MRFFIKDYINKIGTADIIKFASFNNVELNQEEALVLDFYLKNNWEELLYGDPLPIIRNIEEKLGKSKALVITDLFYSYKEKYKNYL